MGWAGVVHTDSVSHGGPANLNIADDHEPRPCYSPAGCSLHDMDSIVGIIDVNEVDILFRGVAILG